jgi:hypothetical protein
MNQKEFMKKVVAILEKQQNVIKKMAQTSHEPPPQHLEPVKITKNEADVILNALKEPAKSSVAKLKVIGSDIEVQFHKGKATQAAYDSLMNTVKELQKSNVLHQQSYNIRVVV